MEKQKRKPRRAQLQKDKGTPELQQKRKVLLNKEETQDLALAESLLGILYAHKMISKPLYEAGSYFGELGYRYEFCLGYSFRQRASPLTHLEGRNFGRFESAYRDALEEKQILAWRKALKVLNEAGKTSYQTVLKVVFYDQDLYTNLWPHSILKELAPLRQGLERLGKHFKNM